MTSSLAAGLSVRVSVPASSANLGPGFDSLGLALDLCDEIEVRTTEKGLGIGVEGEGAADVSRGSDHLVVQAIRRGLDFAGVSTAGLKVKCRNVIPHSRGLGSSAAAVVGGLAAANGLVAKAFPDKVLTTAQLIQLAAEFEGHPDNAAAAILGGATVSWTDDGPLYGAVRLDVSPDIKVHVLIPPNHSSTAETRAVLPAQVSHGDAAFNVSRAALCVVALTSHPEFLLAATEDRLHQPQRAAALPITTEWVTRLRAHGIAAAVSGAGPTVLALSTADLPAELAAAARQAGLRVMTLAISDGVRVS